MYTISDFKNCPKFDSFQHYWFIPVAPNTFDVYQLPIMPSESIKNYKLGTYKEETLSSSDALLVSEFELYKQRPEYTIGHKIQNSNMEEFITQYEKYLVGIMLVQEFYRTGKCDKSIQPMERVLDWLRQTDFYVAPASTIYHDNEIGGLLIHSIRVLNHIYDLYTVPEFSSVSVISATLVALTHDWCKIGLYEPYNRNVKNAEGKWESVVAYRRKSPAIPLGHGVESAYKVMQIFRLTEEEMAAIRWHMGAWNVCSSETNDLQTANEKYPLVHMIQFADSLSIVNYRKSDF